MGASPKEHGYIAVVCGNDAETRLEAGYIDEIQGVPLLERTREHNFRSLHLGQKGIVVRLAIKGLLPLFRFYINTIFFAAGNDASTHTV